MKRAFLLTIALVSNWIQAQDDSICSRLAKNVALELKQQHAWVEEQVLVDERQIELALFLAAVNQVHPVHLGGAPFVSRNPRVQRAIAQAGVVGIEVRRHHARSDFGVDASGKAIIRIRNATELEREMEHFFVWEGLKDLLIDQMDPEEAGRIAFAAMLTPMGSLHVEARSALIDLSGMPAQPEKLDAIFFRRNYPFLSALSHAFKTRSLLLRVDREEVTNLLETIELDTQKILFRLLHSYNGYHDSLQQEYRALLDGHDSEEVMAQLAAWSKHHHDAFGHLSGTDLGSMPAPLLYFSIIHNSSPSERAKSLIDQARAVGGNHADEIVALLRQHLPKD